MSTQHIVQSKYFRVSAVAIGVLLVALVSFGFGMRVGMHKALFSSQWGRNYERNFMGPEGNTRGPQFADRFMGRAWRNGHGLAGDVLSVTSDGLIIKNPENQESTVSVGDATIINHGTETVRLQDVRVGDRVVVIGKPQEDGTVKARLIRIFDPLNH